MIFLYSQLNICFQKSYFLLKHLILLLNITIIVCFVIFKGFFFFWSKIYMISYVFGEGVTGFFHIAKKRNNHVVSIAAQRVLLTGHPMSMKHILGT